MALNRLPSSMFSIVLGLAGLGACWRQMTLLFGMPGAIGEAIMFLAAAVWLVLAVAFVARCLTRWHDVEAELAHPVQCCFFGLAFVATLLMAGTFKPYSVLAAEAFLWIGLAGHLPFIAWRVGRLWTGDRPAEAMTPVLYLPLVAGNFAAAIATGSLGHVELGMLFFGAGMLSWLAIESTVWVRLFVHPEMAPQIRPLIGIQLAPPVVGLVAWMSVNPGPPGPFAYGLLGYGLLQYLILAGLGGWLRQAPFSPAYWAFSFGITAAPLSALMLVANGAGPVVEAIALVLFILANIAIVALAVGTLGLIVQGRLLPPQPAR